MFNTNSMKLFFAIMLVLGFSALAVWPESAEARRFGGGSSFGSKGSRNFSTPRSAPSRSTFQRNTQRNRQSANSSSRNRGFGGLSSGMLGGIGGLMIGGLLGSMLFGGGSTAASGMAGGLGGSGIGLFEILLIGGGIWLFLRWRRQKALQPSQVTGDTTVAFHNSGGHLDREQLPNISNRNLPDTFSFQGDNGGDEIAGAISRITQTDPTFNEQNFLQGACSAFEAVQGAWSAWNVEHLRPLLTDRMLEIARQQAKEHKEAGQRTIIEKIHFESAEVSELWQESRHDWITVHFKVQMIDYLLDRQEKVLEGDPDKMIHVEEYWTFTRPIGSSNPNWFLSAVLQPGDVDLSVLKNS